MWKEQFAASLNYLAVEEEDCQIRAWSIEGLPATDSQNVPESHEALRSADAEVLEM